MRSDEFKYYALEFPFPIAYWFRRAMDRDEAQDDIVHLLLAAVEFVGTATVADYLATEGRDADLDRRLLKLFEAPPSLGEWRDFLLLVIEACIGTRRRVRYPEVR